jgi:hypothetical protein
LTSTTGLSLRRLATGKYGEVCFIGSGLWTSSGLYALGGLRPLDWGDVFKGGWTEVGILTSLYVGISTGLEFCMTGEYFDEGAFRCPFLSPSATVVLNLWLWAARESRFTFPFVSGLDIPFISA